MEVGSEKFIDHKFSTFTSMKHVLPEHKIS